MKIVLAIETSCDDTSLAIVRDDGERIVCDHMAQFSQVIHQSYGGVVPELASREHANKILLVLQELKQQTWHETWSDFFGSVDAVCVTTTPWLPGSLVVGKTLARMIHHEFDLPLVPLNHIYGHVFSLWLERDKKDIVLPALILSVSGGHNHLYLVDTVRHDDERILTVEQHGSYWIHLLGVSRDDAAGECFDKVARMLWGPYPGGKRVGEHAAAYDPDRDGQAPAFTRTFLAKETFDYSFSWLKSQVQRVLSQKETLTEGDVRAVCWAFEEAVVEMLTRPVAKAIDRFAVQTVWLVGGVSANRRLRAYIKEHIALPLLVPERFVYCTDNGAMIGAAWLLGSE